MSGDVDLIRALGAQVVEVPDLADEACWVEGPRVGLIRAGLPDHRVAQAHAWLADQALGGVAAGSPQY